MNKEEFALSNMLHEKGCDPKQIEQFINHLKTIDMSAVNNYFDNHQLLIFTKDKSKTLFAYRNKAIYFSDFYYEGIFLYYILFKDKKQLN